MTLPREDPENLIKFGKSKSVSEMSFDLVQFQAIEYEMYANSHEYRGVEDLQCLHLIPVMKLIVSQVVTWQSERGNKRS